MNMTYRLCKNKITKDMYETQEEMQQMLDVFFGVGRINKDEYLELVDVLDAKHEEV